MLKERRFKISAKNTSLLFSVLGGIDSLYYFADTSDDELYQSFFETTLNECLDFSFDDFQATFSGVTSSKSGGFGGVWYSVRLGSVCLARVGFKSQKIQRNVHSIFIQLDGESIYTYGLTSTINYLFDFMSFFCGAKTITSKNLCDLVVNRADINAFISGWDFSVFDSPDYFKTPFNSFEVNNGDFSRVFGSSGSMQSIYFGSRKGSWSFKLYNKTLEINSQMLSATRSRAALAKQYYLIENGLLKDESSCVWNLEFSFKREILKEFELYSVADVLDNAKTLFKWGLGQTELFCADLDEIKRARKNRNLGRLAVNYEWHKIGDLYDESEAQPIIRNYKKHKKTTLEGFVKYALYRLRALDFSLDEVADCFNENASILRSSS